MTTTDEDPVAFYATIPQNPEHQNYVNLPFYPRRRPPRNYSGLRRCLAFSAVFLLLATATYLLYPSDPDLTLVRLSVSRIQVRTSPRLTLDLSLSLTLKVRNRDFFSLNYSSIVVSIGYRGRELGFVTSDGGKIRARASSYVNATLVLDGFEIIHDVIYLVGDLASGSIPFDTDSEVNGTVGLFSLDVPIKARISCEVYVNPNNRTVIRQDCHHW